MLDKAGGGAETSMGASDDFGSTGATTPARKPAMAGAKGDMDDEIPF